MKRIVLLLFMTLYAALAPPVHAGDFGYVNGTELKGLIDKGDPALVIIDSRSASQFQETRIKGAVSLPLSEMEQDQTLPRVSKEATVVFYCSGNT